MKKAPHLKPTLLWRRSLACALLLALATLAQAADIHVATAANLTKVLSQLGEAFEHETGVHVVPSFGATAQLTQQIENGAPFDVFLSADVQHVDELVKQGFIDPGTRAVYARGQLVVWAPKHNDLHTLDDLTKPDVHAIAVAKPELAPYGEAAVETLKNAKLWDNLQSKIVYAPSISISKQFADTGNADVAFTALSLTIGQSGNQFTVPERLHMPINQALGIVKTTKDLKDARAFTAFVAGTQGQAILKRFGYSHP